MKNVDSAEALGNAIRERSSILLNDDGTPNQSDDIPDEIDSTLASLSFSLGSSSPPTATATHHDSGGIEPSRSSILSNYLFQSHGGAYAFQSLCSLFAVSSGVAAFLLPRHKSALLKRTFQCALAKHGAGMLVASVLAAKQIPALGLARTRGKIKTLSATSPLSQYIFYCCLLLVWMPKDVSNKFYARGNVLSGCLLAPVMLREVVHLGWIFCDVVVILGSEDNLFVKFGRDVLNAAMSLLFGPRSWRDADLYGKQKLLAKFVSRMSLVAEVLVGGIIIMDVLRGLGDVVVGGAVKDGASGNSDGSSVLSVLKSCICARLYIHFLMIRRERIEDLLVKMRGGAKDVPIKVLDTILEPGKAMGLEGSVPTNKKKRTVMNVVGEALGFC